MCKIDSMRYTTPESTFKEVLRESRLQQGVPYGSIFEFIRRFTTRVLERSNRNIIIMYNCLAAAIVDFRSSHGIFYERETKENFYFILFFLKSILWRNALVIVGEASGCCSSPVSSTSSSSSLSRSPSYCTSSRKCTLFPEHITPRVFLPS